MEFNPLRDTEFERELCNLIRDLTFLSSCKYNKVSDCSVYYRMRRTFKVSFTAQTIRTDQPITIRMYMRQRAVAYVAIVGRATSPS